MSFPDKLFNFPQWRGLRFPNRGAVAPSASLLVPPLACMLLVPSLACTLCVYVHMIWMNLQPPEDSPQMKQTVAALR